MSDSARFALHRPEFLGALIAGEKKIVALMHGSAFEIPGRRVLIQAGLEHQYVYRLLRGWAGRTRSLADGRTQVILVFLPGDLFAVKSMFMTRHPDDVVSICDIQVERIHYRELHDVYVKDGDVATRCIWQVMEEERRLHSWVTTLGQGSAEERLAVLLIDFRGRLISSKTIAADTLSFEMPLTQTQLAEMVGITAVHVNRVLKGFREAGVVTVRDGTVVISNLKRLVERAAALLDTHEQSTPAYAGTLARAAHGKTAS
jgi:CRP-like cAMP-binding protein